MVVTQFNLYTNIFCYKYANSSVPKKSPDMILKAFHVKFHAWHQEVPPARPPERGVVEAAAPRKKKKGGMRIGLIHPPRIS